MMKRKINQLSAMVLKEVKKMGYKYMVRSTEEYGGMVFFKVKPCKLEDKGILIDSEKKEFPFPIEEAMRGDMSGMRGLEFIRWKDKKSWEINRLLEITEEVLFNIANAVKVALISELKVLDLE